MESVESYLLHYGPLPNSPPEYQERGPERTMQDHWSPACARSFSFARTQGSMPRNNAMQPHNRSCSQFAAICAAATVAVLITFGLARAEQPTAANAGTGAATQPTTAPSVYTETTPSRDGIGKVYMGRGDRSGDGAPGGGLAGARGARQGGAAAQSDRADEASRRPMWWPTSARARVTSAFVWRRWLAVARCWRSTFSRRCSASSG